MTESMHEAMSRLLAGDLPLHEAEALSARIAADPEAAAGWRAMQALPEALAALPTPPAPSRLDARVVRAAASSGARRARRPRALLAMVAVAWVVGLVVGLARPEARPQLVLVDGDQVVSGRVEVVAGDLHIDVDGVARIEMEPPGGVAREPLQLNQEDSMNAVISAVAGAVAGSAVTVAVMVGTATVRDGDQAVVVGAGEALSRPARAVKVALPQPSRPAPGETPIQAVARLQGEVGQLRSALEEARFTEALAAGQLEAHVGRPQPWPDVLDDVWRPEAVRARAQALAEAQEGVSLMEVDCTEYPCITFFEESGGAEIDPDSLAPEGTDAGVMAMKMAGDGDVTVGGYVVAPREDLDHTSDVGARLEYRAKARLDEIGRDVVEGDREDGRSP